MSDVLLVRGLGEQIVEQLRGEIFSGRIEEGTRLREVDLAKRFSVSHGPIRDAIKQLSWEGVLEKNCNKGALVSSPAPDEITELLIPIRCTLEKFAVRLIFETLTEKDFQAWDDILEKMKTACENKDVILTTELDLAFHRLLVDRSGSRDLIAIWTSIATRVRNHFREANSLFKDPMDNYKDHLAVLDALRSGNLNKALNAIEEHID